MKDKKESKLQKNEGWGFKNEASRSLFLGVKAVKTSVFPISDVSLLAQALGWIVLARI